MIVQCPSCRALVGVTTLVRVDDEASPRAGIRCPECARISTLPLLVDDVERARDAAETLADGGGRVASPTRDAHAPDDTPRASPQTVDDDAGPSALSRVATSAITASVEAALRSLIADDARSLAPSSDAVAVDLPRDGRMVVIDALLAIGARWDERDAHKPVVALAVRQDELAFLGQCYRVVLEHAPDDVGAKQGRDLVLAHAMATLADLPRGDADLVKTARTVKQVAVALGALLLVVTVVFMLRHMGRALDELGQGPSTPSPTQRSGGPW